MNEPQIYLLVYVDDIVITSSKQSAIDTLIHGLGLASPVKDLGFLSFFLGLEVDYTDGGVLQSKPMLSPMEASLKLSKFDSPAFATETGAPVAKT
ncbi:uncharacterized mitochondrial protein AtMg00810-like [Juglans regia]|uniref:Uncharacterized mitochondrial protein AtMg00810-like n=1 Tax=Juglans regia TaxID=51240 RepID=A0A2I4DPL2_JUGRE|nr:uncharacterized mitochondrial protein AtMg00810-like [Juglans regia]